MAEKTLVKAATEKKPLPEVGSKPYIKLSDVLLENLVADQRSDTFVKEFKTELLNETFRAIRHSERITMPKIYHKRDGTTHQKQCSEFFIENSQEFHDWFEQYNTELVSTREGKVPVSIETLNSGMIDFDALYDETRRSLQKRVEQGRKLGKTYGNGGKKDTGATAADEADSAPDEDTTEEVAEAKPAKKTTAPKKPAGKKTAPVAEESSDDDDDNEDLLD